MAVTSGIATAVRIKRTMLVAAAQLLQPREGRLTKGRQRDSACPDHRYETFANFNVHRTLSTRTASGVKRCAPLPPSRSTALVSGEPADALTAWCRVRL